MRWNVLNLNTPIHKLLHVHPGNTGAVDLPSGMFLSYLSACLGWSLQTTT